MKIPDKIETLKDLVKWVETKRPKLIEIGKKSKIRKIAEFNDYIEDCLGENKWSWKFFRDIPIKYL